MHPDWIIPEWPAAPGIRAVFTTRAGGASSGPYASFNLGESTDDDPAAVAANRAHLRGLLPQAPRWLKQVHGSRVVDADAVEEPPEADAAVARRPGTVCAILVADCLPVLLSDRAGTVVAAAHAGWRGLAAGVLEHTIGAMTAQGVAADDLLAWIGPGIGPGSFQVGQDVYDAYTGPDAGAAAAFTRDTEGRWLADLPGLARRALARCGVTAVYGGDHCTYSAPSRFYSYRRDRITGRMGAFIWRE